MRGHRVIAALAVLAALVGLAPKAAAAVLITVDKAAQRMTVAVDGELRWTWPVSTGIASYDTPNGRYTTFRMEEDHYSKEWDDAPMPHSIFFSRIGHAIHGTNQTKKLGRPASHGCVRLAPENAAMLFALVQEQGLPNTRVVIDGDLPPPGAPLVAGRERDDDARGAMRDYGTPDEYERRGRATRSYAAPHDYYEPSPLFGRPQVHEQRRVRVAPRVYYNPRVEIIEDVKINGTWVRRRYYRQARPQDFYGWR
jgi:hypothetical protein